MLTAFPWPLRRFRILAWQRCLGKMSHHEGALPQKFLMSAGAVPHTFLGLCVQVTHKFLGKDPVDEALLGFANDPFAVDPRTSKVIGETYNLICSHVSHSAPEQTPPHEGRLRRDLTVSKLPRHDNWQCVRDSLRPSWLWECHTRSQSVGNCGLDHDLVHCFFEQVSQKFPFLRSRGGSWSSGWFWTRLGVCNAGPSNISTVVGCHGDALSPRSSW
mmetsp:Transcript_53613/g.143387  ORF Transcript_53613/g.143387 Transcript_53613/m.143387 type:complete len:216 (+) Transcript_53613:1504-2151(+)